MGTRIAWTDHTFNPWMGCEKVSAGCTHCYAEVLTKNRMGLSVWGGPTSKRQVTKSPWTKVYQWNRLTAGEGRRRRVFVGSLCDVFEDHPIANEQRARVWRVISECPHLDFQLLTKRPERIAANLPWDWGQGWPNVWLGVSIEDNSHAARADWLRQISTVVRFVSYEPALGPLDRLDLSGLQWVIYGGESGPNHRPEGRGNDPKLWARQIRDRCAAAGVAFFHKQSSGLRSGSGVELDGVVVHQFPEGCK